jgi:hypothetical protein
MATEPGIIKSFQQLKQAIRQDDANEIHQLTCTNERLAAERDAARGIADGCKQAVESAREELEACRAGRDTAQEQLQNALGAYNGLIDAHHTTQAERNEARAERDGAQEERDRWRGKFHGMEARKDEAQKAREYWKDSHTAQESYFQDGIKDDALRCGVDPGGMVGMAIVHTMADEVQKCHQVRSAYWNGVGEAIKHMEDGGSYHAVADALRRVQDRASAAWTQEPEAQEGAGSWEEAGKLQNAIMTAAKAAGISTTQTYADMAQAMATIIKEQRCEAQEGAASWEGSFARLKQTIHHYAVALGIKPGGTCRDIVKEMAMRAEAWASNAADLAGTVKDLTTQSNVLEHGIRDAQEAMQHAEGPLIEQVEGTLHKALEDTGLAGCAPLTPLERAHHALNRLHYPTKGDVEEARAALREAIS